jgi:hypothetical protein
LAKRIHENCNSEDCDNEECYGECTKDESDSLFNVDDIAGIINLISGGLTIDQPDEFSEPIILYKDHDTNICYSLQRVNKDLSNIIAKYEYDKAHRTTLKEVLQPSLLSLCNVHNDLNFRIYDKLDNSVYFVLSDNNNTNLFTSGNIRDREKLTIELLKAQKVKK